MMSNDLIKKIVEKAQIIKELQTVIRAIDIKDSLALSEACKMLRYYGEEFGNDLDDLTVRQRQGVGKFIESMRKIHVEMAAFAADLLCRVEAHYHRDGTIKIE